LATINTAVDVALETSLPLRFLYVVNLDFLSRTSISRVSTISEQMRQMGESILLNAQARAAERGVEAETSVRHGQVGEEISAACHELNADYLVLGRPVPEREDNVFTQARLAEFVQSLEAQTGAKVVLPESEAS
jgi:nucleotide-binding universal stress UspA family protein